MILDEMLKILKEQTRDKAYTVNNKSYSYSEVYKYVCNIYNFLISENKEKRPIIVYGNKEIYMKTTFLACSFAGITYVPVDESIPNERINLIIQQVKPYCIIGDFKHDDYKTITKEEIYKIMQKEKFHQINEIYLKSGDIYYMIFTSGTTGIPKGVKVSYENIDSCIRWLKDITKIKKGVILNQANFSFDLSVADLYLSTITKSEHYILSNDSKFDFEKIFMQLKESEATFAVLTPSFAELLLLDKKFSKQLLPHLETIIFCGEKLLHATIKKIYERFDKIKIINSYGPTECTFAVTSIEVTPEIMKEENIPVGIPKKDVDIIIVDKDKNRLAEGKNGEILILGKSVAEGYLEVKDNDAFIVYNDKKGYLTGDLGYMKNGILYYENRIDNQIKYKGYRIEISDIEKNIYSLGYIERVQAIAKKTSEGKVTKISAFVKLKSNVKKSELEIRKDLLKKIPEYMCPNIKILNEFPINNNGKINIEELRSSYNGTKNN